MWKVIAELPLETTVYANEWALRVRYLHDTDNPSDEPKCVAYIFHRHLTGKSVRMDDGAHKAQEISWQPARLENREEFRAKKESPRYTCNGCTKEAPEAVVDEKLALMRKHRGYDPRNNRRAAIMATREKQRKRDE